MNINLQFVSKLVAEQISEILAKSGLPSENRVLILSPNNETTTQSGIIIPEAVKEGVPRKGVVIFSGYIDEAHESYKGLVQTGRIVTYGMYAGKEVEFDNSIFPAGIQKILEKNKFSVLSLNEIIYSEVNE